MASFPLPKDHWLYAPSEYDVDAENPKELPSPILTHAMRAEVVSAIRYAIRGATMCGKETDFDPDALVQNAVYALCGPYGSATHVAPAPDMTDAYAGAREDLSIWKKRALEAEALNRKFAASVNSPSFMGEQAEPVDAAKLPSPANVGTAPKCLNLNDRAMWVLGWNECLDAARAVLAKWGGSEAQAAAPVGMEPVAWVEVRPGLDGWFLAYNFNPDAQTEPLYSGFQVQAMLSAARKPITDEVLHALYADAMSGHYVDALHYWKGTPAHQYARAIENAHGIKATNPESNN